MISLYRTDWWRNSEIHVELWAEKKAVKTYLSPIARDFGIRFLATRGFASFTAIYEAVQRFGDKPAKILYFGDFDPSGVKMDTEMESRLLRMGADAEIIRVALTRDQVDFFDLLPQPTKRKDSRARNWPHEGSWELDALDEAVLMRMAREAIEDRLPDDFEDLRQEDDENRRAMSIT